MGPYAPQCQEATKGNSRGAKVVASPSVKFSYSPDVDAAYVRVTENRTGGSKQVVVDDEQLWKPIIIDLDSEGHVVGFEFLDASELLPAHLLDEYR